MENILFSDGYAAGRQNDIRLQRGMRKRIRHILRIIGQLAQLNALNPQLCKPRRQRHLIGIVDFSEGQRLPRLSQLIPRTQQRGTHPTDDLHARLTYACQNGQMGCRQLFARMHQHLARRDILTRQTDIPAMTHGRVYFGVIHSLIGILLTDNAVAGFGNRRTGHHPNCLAPRRTEHLAAARAGFADYPDHSGMLTRGIRNVFAVQRIAIQRRTIERRHIHRRNDILRRDSVQRIQKRQLLRVRHRLRVRKQNA